MAKSAFLQQALLEHIFLNATIPGIGDATGLREALTEGNVWAALYTGTPGTNGTTNETNYSSYARVAIPRNTGYWDVSGNVLTTLQDTVWPQATGGSSTITHWAIVTAASGTCELIISGVVPSAFLVTAPIQPRIRAGDLTHTEG